MPRKKDTSDPHAQREAEKYDNPIPSREFILGLMEERGKPLTFVEISEHLQLYDEQDSIALQRRLRAMERDGQILRNRKDHYCLVDHTDLVKGRVDGHRDGHGFLNLDESDDRDWFISPREMREVFHGDHVLARPKGYDRRGRTEAAIVEVLEDSISHIVGRYYEDSGTGFVAADNTRIQHDILIAPDDNLNAEEDQVVVVRITARPKGNHAARGVVVDILGDYMAPGVEIQTAIHNYQLPFEWPSAVQEAVTRLPVEVTDADIGDRKDLRDLPLLTIDGADARDFDDAVFCRPREEGGWTLYVAIADVSHYVRPGSALDEEAINRGNSVYFPNNVIPMLPELLSNGLCSLNPDVDRLCMVCELDLDAQGHMGEYRFYPAVMHSKARMTYSKVWAILDGDEKLRAEYAEVVPHLEELYRLFKARLAIRRQRGAIEFETTETRIEFNDERKIERIVPVVRNDAHKIIEECMICANVASAQFLLESEVPAIFRIHETPSAAKLEDFRAFLGELGLFLFGGDSPAPADYAELLKSIKGRPDEELISTMLLRSMMQAVYSANNKGHFGLAFDAYTHFTSPIRRYPDLLVHRIIKQQLRDVHKSTSVPGGQAYEKAKLEQLGEHCSLSERRADKATRDVVDWLKCEYMLTRVGEECWGTVSTVTSFGLFVLLDDLFVEGLVHISSLGEDYFHFDPTKARLVGEHQREIFKIGHRVKVSVARVDLEDRKIDFELVERERTERDSSPAKGKERQKLYGKADTKKKDGKKADGRGAGKGGKRSGKKPVSRRQGKKPVPKTGGGKKTKGRQK